jgi:hypothetical protein
VGIGDPSSDRLQLLVCGHAPNACVTTSDDNRQALAPDALKRSHILRKQKTIIILGEVEAYVKTGGVAFLLGTRFVGADVAKY